MQKNNGFTLVELLITLVISGIIIAAIYSAYIVQQRSYTAQEAVAEMQQNMRAAMMLMSRDIRMAGFAPGGGTFGFVTGDFDNGTGQAEAVVTDATNIAFTADLDNDGNIDRACEDANNDGRISMDDMEQIAYRLNGTDLQRYSTTTGIIAWHTIAENIENIEFQYLDIDGNPTTTINDIRTVGISILARASRPDRNFINNRLYCPASSPLNTTTGLCENLDPSLPPNTWGPYNDNNRRRLLITTIQLRNMGL